MTDQPIKAYGEGRVRAGVSYAQVERAAITILKSERRPTVETVREVLGTGSPDTIALALKRFWRDLGARIEGDPAALTRMPGEIAELADGMWQQALTLAGEAAAHDDNAARERLRQLELENEIKSDRSTCGSKRSTRRRDNASERSRTPATISSHSRSCCLASRPRTRRRRDASPISRRRPRSIERSSPSSSPRSRKADPDRAQSPRHRQRPDPGDANQRRRRGVTTLPLPSGKSPRSRRRLPGAALRIEHHAGGRDEI